MNIEQQPIPKKIKRECLDLDRLAELAASRRRHPAAMQVVGPYPGIEADLCGDAK